MTKTINGFTFVHNAIDSGYPIIESIETVREYVDDVYVVDMQSTDTTRLVLEKLGVNIIEGKWGNQAGQTLADAHALHSQCEGDIILHFEADEVYNQTLLQEMIFQISLGKYNLSVWRLQLEQNFQRCRWYPHPDQLCHRVFQKNTVTKDGCSTNWDISDTMIIDQKYGLIWDITNCFRDNWLNRVEKQAELRGDKGINLLQTPHHTNELSTVENIGWFLEQPHWKWKQTPYNIPTILKHLVGVTKYSESLFYKRLGIE